MKRHVLLLLIPLTLLLGCAGGGDPAPDDAWRLLGQARLQASFDRTEVVLGEELLEVSTIQLRVTGRALKNVVLSVRYSGGGREDFTFRRNIQPGGPSREIQLPVPQTIEHAELVFEPEGTPAGRAVVRLFGKPTQP